MTRNKKRIFAELLDVAPDELYGWRLMELTGIKAGSLYPALRGMRDAGMIVDRMERVDGTDRFRRYYRLTPGGLRVAQELAAGGDWRVWVPGLTNTSQWGWRT